MSPSFLIKMFELHIEPIHSYKNIFSIQNIGSFRSDVVLYWWGGHCYPMHCNFLKIYCAPPNLGITRTWICRLNFTQRPIVSGLSFFNEPEISDSGPPAYSSSRRTCAKDFYVLKKSIDLSRVRIREPWISRRAHYSETTEADILTA